MFETCASDAKLETKNVMRNKECSASCIDSKRLENRVISLSYANGTSLNSACCINWSQLELKSRCDDNLVCCSGKIVAVRCRTGLGVVLFLNLVTGYVRIECYLALKIILLILITNLFISKLRNISFHL